MSPSRTCQHCDDPLPADGHCDCAGDPERDYRTQRFDSPHAVVVRMGRKAVPGRQLHAIMDGVDEDDSVVEMWI